MSEKGDLLIIYNADSTLRGKVTYAYRKLSSKQTACAACDITHGGLSLSEVPKWKETKQQIESQGWKVLQWHRDEVEQPVKEWIQANSIRYPTVLLRSKDDDGANLKMLADTGELVECAGDATRLLELLNKKNVTGETKTSSL